MNEVWRSISKSKGLISIFTLGTGNIIGTIISAIAIILFSRYLGPSEFGIFSAAFATLQIMVRVADFGLNIAAERSISRVNNKNQFATDQYIRVTLWIKIVISIIVISLGMLITPWIALNLLHIENLQLIRLAILLSSGTVFFEFTGLLFQATQRFGKVARITIIQAIGKLIIGLILIWQNSLTAVSALLLYGIMPILGALSGWNPLPFTKFLLPTNWVTISKNILKVTKWTSIAAISATLAENIDILMVQSFLSSFETGLWSAAARIAAFANIIGWSIGAVLSNRVTSYTDKKHLDIYLSKAWKIGLGSFLLIICGIPFSDIALILTVGKEYITAAGSLQLLLLSSALTAAISPYVALFYLFDKPKYYAIVGILQTIILLIGDYILIPIAGIVGASWVRILVRIFVLFFTIFYVRSAYKEKYT